MEPDSPSALGNLMGGRAKNESARDKYEHAHNDWRDEHSRLETRGHQLEKRLNRVKAYAEHPARTAELAHRNVERKQPELAHALKEHRAWNHDRAHERAKDQLESGRQRGSERGDRGYER